MKENILILVNSFISCSKNQYFKTQLINTEHRTQNTDTEHRTQTHVKNVLHKVGNVGNTSNTKFGNKSDDINFMSKHYDKCIFVLKCIQQVTFLIYFHWKLYKMPTLPTLCILEKFKRRKPLWHILKKLRIISEKKL